MPGLLFMYIINLIACCSSFVYWFNLLNSFHIHFGVHHVFAHMLYRIQTVETILSAYLVEYIGGLCWGYFHVQRDLKEYEICGPVVFWEIYEFCSIFCQINQKYKSIYGYIHTSISQYHSDTGRLYQSLLSSKLSQSRNARQQTKQISISINIRSTLLIPS